MYNAIKVVQGDITQFPAEALVNAANRSLLGGGGVDGAIHRAAGPALLAACRKLGGCETGQAKITPGFNLSAKWVIHTVGPVWRGGSYGEPELLAACHQNSLALAIAKDVKTLAFPAISCGVYGYPVEAAAQVAITSTLKVVNQANDLQQVTFVCFSDEVFNTYQQVLSGFD
jgi:O-acetyl-ADP-ribose deacetylase (regulator of RNase III)